MFSLLFSIVFATAALVTAFLLLNIGNMKKLRQRFAKQQRQLPVVTLDGKVLDTKEDLEVELQVLESKLNEKKSVLEVSKTKLDNTQDSIEKLNFASTEVRKYYRKLRDEMARSENECKLLQKQIEDYRQRQEQMRLEIRSNERRVQELLRTVNVDSISSVNVDRPSEIPPTGRRKPSCKPCMSLTPKRETPRVVPKNRSPPVSDESLRACFSPVEIDLQSTYPSRRSSSKGLRQKHNEAARAPIIKRAPAKVTRKPSSSGSVRSKTASSDRCSSKNSPYSSCLCVPAVEQQTSNYISRAGLRKKLSVGCVTTETIPPKTQRCNLLNRSRSGRSLTASQRAIFLSTSSSSNTLLSSSTTTMSVLSVDVRSLNSNVYQAQSAENQRKVVNLYCGPRDNVSSEDSGLLGVHAVDIKPGRRQKAECWRSV